MVIMTECPLYLSSCTGLVILTFYTGMHAPFRASLHSFPASENGPLRAPVPSLTDQDKGPLRDVRPYLQLCTRPHGRSQFLLASFHIQRDASMSQLGKVNKKVHPSLKERRLLSN